MSTRRYLACILGLTGSASLLAALNQPPRHVPLRARSTAATKPLSLPVAFEENVGQAAPGVQFVGRGRGLTILLTEEGLEFGASPPVHQQAALLEALGRAQATKNSDRAVSALKIKFLCTGAPRCRYSQNALSWQRGEPLRGETNYFLGRDSRRWRTHVAHFAQVRAAEVLPGVGVVVYGGEEGVEYDLQIAPGANAENLLLQLSGAYGLRLDSQGDLYMRVADREIRMRKPILYQAEGERVPVEGGYVLHQDATVGFHVGPHHADATLVLDPSLSVSYASFLGGAGDDAANSIALDSAGNIYVSGTTTSAASFPEPGGTKQGPGGDMDFFLAKIDPAAGGPNSLIYLTFLGGSGDESGGSMAVDATGNAAIMGVTNSPDYPVTDGSRRTSGANDLAVTEIDPSGSKLVYSTLLGGNGSESTQGSGGIAFDKSGNIFVASDTTSTDLPATPMAFQTAYGGGSTDGFLMVLRPSAVPHIKYCSYLGLNAQLGVSGVAVDAGGNAYVAGFTSNPGASFTAINGFQAVFGGGPFDAFLMKIRPSGSGAADLAYGTLLGGSGSDQAFAVTVGAPMPATAYVTGATSSPDFPLNATTVGPQTKLKARTANAFFAAIAQNATTGKTSLAYSTYLGGSQSDAGLVVAVTAPNSAYVAGRTTSWDFSWQFNFQPFGGDEDAFVVKLDPTSTAAASLIYATPLGGTAPPGFTAATQGNALAADASGHVYLAGKTSAADFPRAGNPGNGFQVTCASCQGSPQAGDAFVVALAENAAAAPSLSFNAPNVNFGQQSVGSKNVPFLVAGLVNTGNAPLNVTSLEITGRNSADFSLAGSEPCFMAPILPGVSCSFEIGFAPSIVGPEQAFIVIADDAPGSPQALELKGVGSGPLAVFIPSSINFASLPENATPTSQPLTIANQGNQALTITNVALGGPDAAQFKFVASSCSNISSLPPGGACQEAVFFSPTAVGTFHAEIDVTDNSGGSPGAVQAVQLTGTGTLPAPVVRVLPAALTFGSQAVGTTSGAQIVSVTNLGSTALAFSGIGLSGGDAVNFGVVSTGNSPCPISSGTLAIGAACNVGVNFAPLTSGVKSATLNFSDNAGDSPQIVPLAGGGIAPAVNLSPLNLDFGTQTVGAQSSAQVVSLANVGSVPLAVNSIRITGSNSGDFLQTNNCPPSLGVNTGCVISVTMTPLAVGNRSASLTIADNAPASPQVVPLTGVAAQAALSLSPATLNFGNQPAGTASQPVAIKVTDAGSGKLAISKISVSGVNAADFTETDNCSVSISPAASCTIQVTFTPVCASTPTLRTAMLTLIDNAPGSPQPIPLSGTASGSICIDPPPTGLSQSVSPPQSATFQLTLISVGGYTGQASLTCNGAPANSSCTPMPSTMALGAGSATAFQVVVTTMAPSLAPGTGTNPDRAYRDTYRPPRALCFTLAGCIAVAATFAGRRRRSLRLTCVQLAALAVLLATGVACGGSGGATITNPGTAPGPYALTVSATAGNTTSTLTLTLNVN